MSSSFRTSGFSTAGLFERKRKQAQICTSPGDLRSNILHMVNEPMQSAKDAIWLPENM